MYLKLFSAKYISLRAKLLWSLLGITLLFSTIDMIITFNFIQTNTIAELSTKIDLIVNLTKEQITNNLVYNEVLAMKVKLVEISQADPDIIYILVINANKHIVSHSFPQDKIPQFLLNTTLTQTNHFFDPQIKLRLIHKHYPLLQGQLGYMAIGLNTQKASHNGWNHLKTLGFMSLTFLLLGAGGIILSTHIFIDPIYQLIAGIKAFVPGKKIPIFEFKTHDEVSYLKLNLEKMMQRINSLDRQFKEAQSCIIETEKLANVGTLAAGIAHEINNPIAGIQLCIHRLKKTTQQEKRANYLQLMEESASHIKEIVQDLLQFSHNSDQAIKPIDVNKPIQLACKLMAFRLEKEGISLSLQFEKKPVLIYGQMRPLAQVFINLMINSLDALRNNPPHQKHIFISSRLLADAIEIVFKDNGCGIKAANLDKIFDPFFSSKGAEGTGLGLFVTYNIIKNHQGTISIASEENKSCQVTIQFKLIADEISAPIFPGKLGEKHENINSRRSARLENRLS